jgi:hypothetical protein
MRMLAPALRTTRLQTLTSMKRPPVQTALAGTSAAALFAMMLLTFADVFSAQVPAELAHRCRRAHRAVHDGDDLLRAAAGLDWPVSTSSSICSTACCQQPFCAGSTALSHAVTGAGLRRRLLDRVATRAAQR